MRFLTAGESHGPCLTVVVEGLPAGLPLQAAVLNADLVRRQQGHGRGARQLIERDHVVFEAGVRLGVTTGAPVALRIENRDHASWALAMSPEPPDPSDDARQAAIAERTIARLRPGHADWAGAVKYGLSDVRDVLERASARETAARVAAGAIARVLLRALGIELTSHVVAIGAAALSPREAEAVAALPLEALRGAAEGSPVRCAQPEAAARMVAAIDAAAAAGTSLGGVVEVRTGPLPVGLGSHVHWDRRLDGRLAQAVVSIQALKGVSFGDGFALAGRTGQEAHDEFEAGFGRRSNRAGGLEGGMTNGQPLCLQAVMKPISTQARSLRGADLGDGSAVEAHFERADTCAVPAAAVVAEAMVAWVLAEACVEKYGGDSLAELLAHHAASEALVGVRVPRPAEDAGR
ncbi:MAG: chorismate synthase [Candidatus Sericytochromatia bacterium]|nr:chorismate synthase [Candidatus Sericytochromatia bacterium]